MRSPDMLIPGQWAVEFKVARPFGDNGRPAKHWSENLPHPYPGNTSSLGDCLKLLSSELTERKAIMIFGFEHTPPRVSLDAAVRGFELLAKRWGTEFRGNTELRLDVLNIADNKYQIRNGSGVGVGASQFGLRRTILVGVTQRF
jgi:hypothetical protein